VYFPLTAILIICLASHLSKEEPRRQLILGVLAAVNVVWVFLSTSRGGLLVSILCLLFLMLNMPGLSRRIFFLVGAVLIGSYITSHFAESQTKTIERVEKLVDPNLSADSRTSGRYNLVLGGWLIFLDNPMGVGTGGYASNWAKLNDVEAASVLSGFATGSEMAAHSAWIKTLAENGVPGFMLFAAYVFSFAYVGFKKRRRQGLLLLGALTTAVLSVAFISTEFQSKGLWLMAAGATVILHQRRVPDFGNEPLDTEAHACGDARYEEDGCYK
jgi:O-antigen ligase